jgi:hypothetical protein
MNVFICICASDRPLLLDNTLYSLNKLNKPKEISLFVIVIDNNTYRRNKFVVKKYQNNSKFKIYYKIELKKGIVYARNKFLSSLAYIKTKIDLVGFIDDDCEVEKNWLINHIFSLKKTDSEISTGPQIIKDISKQKKIFFDLTNRQNVKNLSKIKWAATNNVVFKYDVIKKFKIKFDIFLNNIGGSDQLFFLMLNKFGCKIVWNQKALVIENLERKKMDLQWFYNRNLRYGYSGAYMHKIIYGKYFGTLVSFLKVIYYLINILYLFFFSFKVKNRYKVKMYFSKVIGIVKFYFGKKILSYN